MALGFTGAPRRHLAGLVSVVALVLDGGGDLRRALGEQLAGPLGHAGDAPVAEPSRRPVVGFDGVAQLDRLGRRRHPPERRGGVQYVPQRRRVERFPASFVVGNAAKVVDQNMVVGLRVTGPGGGVARARPDQAVGGDTGLGAPPAPAAGYHPGVQVGQSGLGLGVQNGVHVIGPADQPEQCDRLVGGHHELHPRPFGVHQPLPIGRVAGTAGAKDSVVLRLGYRTGEAQVSSSRTAPNKRCLASGRVIIEGRTGVVVGPSEHRFPVVIYGLSAHHPHPGHLPVLLVSVATKGPSGRGNRSVAIVFEKKVAEGEEG